MRVANRVAGLILGLALVGAGGFCAFEVVLAATGHRFLVVPGRAWLDALRTTPWSAPTAILIVAVIAAVGVVVLVAELVPRRRPRLELPASRPGARWWVWRRSAESLVRRQVEAETPATRVRLHLVPRRRSWRAKVRSVAGAQTAPAIAESAEAALGRLGAPDAVRIRVKLSKPGRVA
ncbi:MAG: hypothetical protein ACRDZY_13265 [Acidimicrobiales bacterium]